MRVFVFIEIFILVYESLDYFGMSVPLPQDTEPLSCFKMHHAASNHDAEAECLRSTASTASRKNCKEFNQIIRIIFLQGAVSHCELGFVA